MRVVAFHDPADFAAATRDLLLEREAENNLLFGLLDWPGDPAGRVMRAVFDGDRAVAAALQTDPAHNLVLSHGSNDAFDALADALLIEGRSLPGTQGSAPGVHLFAQRWAKARGAEIRRVLSLGVYQLTKVIPPRPVRGKLHVAMLDDLPIVARFVREFVGAIGEADTGDHVDGARRRIESGAVALWSVGGQAVSIAASSGPTPNGIRVNLVYTPPELRNRGYASACVAALSQKLLDSGRKFCFLFTDLDNPTSNKIYRDIGYEFVAQQHQFAFDAR